MTEEQQKRVQELEEQAKNNLFEARDYAAVDWLDTDEEKKEYCELKDIQLMACGRLKSICICGLHKQ
jgi:hypothetical protein